MDWSAYGAIFLQLFIPTFLSITVICLAVAFLYWIFLRQAFGLVFGFVVAFGFLGGVAGLIAGASSEPIVGAFLTGFLALLSGLISFRFSEESLDSWRTLIPAGIVVLCVSALAGLSVGRVYQSEWRAYERQYEERQAYNASVGMPLSKLQQQFEYCREQANEVTMCDSILAD